MDTRAFATPKYGRPQLRIGYGHAGGSSPRMTMMVNHPPPSCDQPLGHLEGCAVYFLATYFLTALQLLTVMIALCAGAAAAMGQTAPPAALADPQSCLKETGDYVTHGKTVTYVIGLTNTCARRLRCEIFANISGARGTALGHTVMTLGPAGSGAAAQRTYTMHVKAAGGIAQVSRDCKAL